MAMRWSHFLLVQSCSHLNLSWGEKGEQSRWKGRKSHINNGALIPAAQDETRLLLISMLNSQYSTGALRLNYCTYTGLELVDECDIGGYHRPVVPGVCLGDRQGGHGV